MNNNILEIAQWVIDNRNTPFEGERMTSTEMFHLLVDKMQLEVNASYKRGAMDALIKGNDILKEIGDQPYGK